MNNEYPLCASADPVPTVPTFLVPRGSCDTHAHVFGPANEYPYCANRSYTPPDAPLKAYQHLHNTLGIDRGVLIQPSVYGTDNSLHRDALIELRKAGRDYCGVCVVAPDVTERELTSLESAGFCGIRMNLLFKGGIEWSDVTRLAHRIADRGWHLQVLIDISESTELLHKLNQLPVPIVIDHMGHMGCHLGLDHPGFQNLLRCLQAGNTWVKLSGSYRISQERKPPYSDVARFAQALVAANPSRCLWGSDWPHPQFKGEMPNDGYLLNLLAQWVPDTQLRQSILVDNPIELYHFQSG